MKSTPFYRIACFTALSMALVINTNADEVDIGALVSRCSECHTEKGLAGIPGWPSIAGMEKSVIVAKLKGHRAGLVSDSTMKKVAHDLSDKEIDTVAEHFSSMLPVGQ